MSTRSGSPGAKKLRRMAPPHRRDYRSNMGDVPDWAERTEQRLLDAALAHVRELGWTSRLVRRAAADVGLTAPEADLLLPQGARDLAALFSHRHDEQALEALSAVDPGTLKVRQRIARGVQAWIDAAMSDEATLRRWTGFMALPQNLPLAGRLAWTSADRIWRWAGDTATDENHYSKRAILAALLTSTLMVRLSGSPAAAALHLERGVDAVMNYERLKARFTGQDFGVRVAETLGGLRRGAHKADETITPA